MFYEKFWLATPKRTVPLVTKERTSTWAEPVDRTGADPPTNLYAVLNERVLLPPVPCVTSMT